MHIAVNGWFWDQPATGSGQYVRMLVPTMATLRPEYEHTLVTLVRTGRRVRGRQARGNLITGGSLGHVTRALAVTDGDPRTQRLVRPLAKLWFEQISFPRACSGAGADVAHVPYFAPPVWATTPTVVTVHDLIPVLLPAYQGSVLVRAYTRLVAAGTRRADAVIADSEHSKADIVRYLDIPPDRVRVVYLAANPCFHPLDGAVVEALRRKYGLPERYILYLGGFDVRKNVPTLLQAFARLVAMGPSSIATRLVVAGQLPGSDDPFAPDPRSMAAALGISDAVVFPGWIDEADKPALYNGATLFVYPSSYEGFGLPPLEAMACGTPVITTGASSLPEVVGEAALTVEPSDVESLADGIQELLVNPDRRQAMRTAGLVQAARFNWVRTAQQTCEVYQHIIA